jgi:hypothetical protein
MDFFLNYKFEPKNVNLKLEKLQNFGNHDIEKKPLLVIKMPL